MKTSKGDWIELVKKDFEAIDEEFNEELVKSMTKLRFKNYVKAKIEKAAFKHLIGIKASHSKLSDVKYKKLEPQPYILCPEFTNEQVNILFAFR